MPEPTKKMKIELVLSRDGKVQFARFDEETNKITYELVSKLTNNNLDSVRDFLDGSDEMERILGDDILCG